MCFFHNKFNYVYINFFTKEFLKYIFLLILIIFFNHRVFADNLNYDFLIANPQMQDSRFKESVIIMFYHNKFGASGLVLNIPEEKISVEQLFDATGLTHPKDLVNKELTIYWGGPINTRHVFFVHSPDYSSKNPIIANENFIITRSSEILFEIAQNKGPKNFIIIKGFAIWSPGQLDTELNEGVWEKKSNHYLSIFNNGQEMWKNLLNSQDA